MCGIVGAVAQRDVVPILLEGLRRLEYRGYDSAGLAVLDDGNSIGRARTAGKVANLEALLSAEPKSSGVGIAHTRWATHGKPTESNAHPHVSGTRVALVHNGIIENHQPLREEQMTAGYVHTSETDTEVIAHQVDRHLVDGKDLLKPFAQLWTSCAALTRWASSAVTSRGASLVPAVAALWLWVLVWANTSSHPTSLHSFQSLNSSSSWRKVTLLISTTAR